MDVEDFFLAIATGPERLPDLQPRGLHDWHIRILDRSCQRGL